MTDINTDDYDSRTHTTETINEDVNNDGDTNEHQNNNNNDRDSSMNRIDEHDSNNKNINNNGTEEGSTVESKFVVQNTAETSLLLSPLNSTTNDTYGMVLQQPQISMQHGGGGTTTTTTISTIGRSSFTSPTTPISIYGPMQSIVIVLRNYHSYGLSERVIYHFHALQQSQSQSIMSNNSNMMMDDSVRSTITNNNNLLQDESLGSIQNSFTSLSSMIPTTQQSQQQQQPQLVSRSASVSSSTSILKNISEDCWDQSQQQLLSSLSQSQQQQQDMDNVNNYHEDYGIIRILECIPTKPWQKLSRRQKRDFKLYIRQCNYHLSHHHHQQQHRSNNNTNNNNNNLPFQLPFTWNAQTRLYTTYEITRIAYIIDASSTMTTTYQEEVSTTTTSNTTNDTYCCPLDRLVAMSSTYFTSLIQPITIASQTNTIYQPQYTITVLAVYPTTTTKSSNSSNPKCTSVLVRDYHVSNIQDVKVLCQKIQEFCSIEVENEIAYRMTSGNSSTTLNTQCSILQNMIDAGYVALSSLSDVGRPIIVIGTDCCSVQCPEDDATTTTSSTNYDEYHTFHGRSHYQNDVPIIVLDASSPIRHNRTNNKDTKDTTSISSMNYDPEGALFPFNLSDDSEMIYRYITKSGGSFWNDDTIRMGATTYAGQVESNSYFSQDYYFAYKHSIQPNAIQWYTLFTLSPLSPRIHDMWGKLPPPTYMMSSILASSKHRLSLPPDDTTMRRYSMSTHHESISVLSSSSKRTTTTSTIFSNYMVNPIPIHEILLMRVKEGYSVKQYGQNMNDNDRISILFTLSLDMDITLRYELSFKSLSSSGVTTNNAMIGVAHIKIELEGDTDFIWLLKNEFLNNQGGGTIDTQQSPNTVLTQQISTRICTYLRGIRRGDLLQSYLSPIKWTDQLLTTTTPFVRRIGTLTTHQRWTHYCRREFDCICIGHMPWTDDDFLSEFRDNDDGSEQLIDTIKTWSTQTIIDSRRFIKQTNPDCGVAGYAIVSIVPSPIARRLFTVVLETFHGMTEQNRLNLLTSIKDEIQKIRNVQILPKQFSNHLVVTTNIMRLLRNEQLFSQYVLESLQNHTSWDLVKDPELTPLLVKRRIEIGKFVLLDSSDSSASFAKLFENETTLNREQDPGNLSQYRFVVLDDKVVVDLFMECESGTFFPFRNNPKLHGNSSKFNQLVGALKKRDQECGHALKCRTHLLRAFSSSSTPSSTDSYSESYYLSIQKLLNYASKVSIRLRFFASGIDESNNILHSLTSESLLSQSFGPEVAELPVSPSAKVTDVVGNGNWFIVEYDKHTCSIVHFSNESRTIPSPESETSNVFRELSFFTFGISDLYNKRDDVEDDTTDEDHISEHLQVTEFCDWIQEIHEKNFSYAAYHSLLHHGNAEREDFCYSDISEIMKPLDFTPVAQVTIDAGHPLVNDTSKLLLMFQSILSPFPGDSSCFFYHNKEPYSDETLHHDDSGDLHYENLNIDCTDDDDYKSTVSEETNDAKESAFTPPINAGDVSEMETAPEGLPLPAPIFVRFLIDGAFASIANLAQVESLSTVSILISVFKKSEHQRQSVLREGNHQASLLPSTHLNSSFVLSFLLNAFVAEQILERLRSKGSSLNSSDIRQAKICLRNAHNILTCKVEVLFYSRNSDKMVKASESHVTVEVDEVFDLIGKEFRKNTSLLLKVHDSVVFLSEIFDHEHNELKHWCFLKIQRSDGLIIVEIYHPGGLDQANELMHHVVDEITSCCHRVNQLLLLLNLNSSRIASPLLIPDSKIAPSDSIELNTQRLYAVLPDGHFACPIVYRTSFDLFYRFAGNPLIMVRSLEAFVLHNFAVSNRPEVFVYKDESGSIFYMKLNVTEAQSAEKGDTSGDSPGSIDLLVYGVDAPDSSITQQLRKLLHKHLLTKAVERISTVLTKNPRYHWRQPDITFIKSFPTLSNLSDNDNSVSVNDKVRTYAFPSAIYDPGMVALFFRQNLCGSTFIHPLITTEWEKSSLQTEAPDISDDSDLHFQPTDLVFYYNTSSSDLDPSLQSESTLTAKGAQYASQTGIGLAIIEVSLLNSDGCPLLNMKAAVPSQYDDDDSEVVSFESLTFNKAMNNGEVRVPSDKPIQIRVQIADTDLKTNILHEWILLSLNQALVAWNVERQLQRIQTREEFKNLNDSQNETKVSMASTSPGLSTLLGMLEFAQKLPDPTSLLTECSNVVRSSLVASVALDLLENVVLDQLKLATKSKIVADKHYKQVVIHTSRSSSSKIVKLGRNANGSVIVRRFTDNMNEQTLLNDSSIDCPEYTIFFYSPEYSTLDEATHLAAYPKLFKDVAVGYETSGEKGDFAKSLFEFKRNHRRFFRRSFAFVLKVKRNRRFLLAYNWSASLFKRVEKRLAEMENTLLQINVQSVQLLNFRSLSLLAPFSNVKTPTVDLSTDVTTTTSTKEKEKMELERLPLARQSTLPPTIRRPKLVGKSIDGSALQAVAKSRARASATRFKPIPQSSTPVSHRKSSSAEVLSTSRNPSNCKNAAPNIHFVTEEQRLEMEDINLVQNQLQRHVNRTNASQSTILLTAGQELAKAHWPLKIKKTVSHTLAECIFALGYLSWLDVSAMLPSPKVGTRNFLTSFGETIITFCPWLSIIKVNGHQHDSLWLMGKARSLKSCRALVSIKITVLNGKVHLEGRLLTMPRQNEFHRQSQTTLENVAAGLDKLSGDVQKCIGLQGYLLDTCGYMIERALKSVNTTEGYDDVVSILRPLIDFYPLQNIMKTVQSNYKVYKANIVLASYANNLISSFSGKELYGWLSRNINQTKLVNCGASGLCFKKMVSVNTTQSIVLLNFDDKVPGNMYLDIVCRTQGKDLYDFMFREGSNVAVSIFGNIAIEAAILTYVEIRAAAINLRRDHLWNSFVVFRDGSTDALLELLNLCIIVPFEKVIGDNEEVNQVLTICNDSTFFNPTRFCTSMCNDPAFLRTWESTGTENNSRQYLFYIPNDDYYLLVSTYVNGVQFQLELIDRTSSAGNEKRTNLVIQKVVNFILFFIWSETNIDNNQ